MGSHHKKNKFQNMLSEDISKEDDNNDGEKTRSFLGSLTSKVGSYIPSVKSVETKSNESIFEDAKIICANGGTYDLNCLTFLTSIFTFNVFIRCFDTMA